MRFPLENEDEDTDSTNTTISHKYKMVVLQDIYSLLIPVLYFKNKTFI